MLTSSVIDEVDSKFTSDSEMDLDLPSGNLKKKIAIRVYESSDAENDNRSIADNASANSEDDDQSSISSSSSSNPSGRKDYIQDSELEDNTQCLNSQSRTRNPYIESHKKKVSPKKAKKFLSNEFIINSDIDGLDEPEGSSSEGSLSARSGNELDVADGSTDRIIRRRTSSKNKPKRIKKANEFVKASGEDFKTTLKFVGYDSESDYDSYNEFESEAEAEADDESGQITKNAKNKTNSTNKISTSKIKKPKESLKSVLKESESLLRRQEPVSLPIDVIKPRSLNLVLNEALATNSKAPKEAIKMVIEEKRRMQRMKLEKLLGKERMSDLIKDNPRIGHDKLDETVEIQVIERVEDEKAPLNGEAEEVIVEKIKFKLVDLPDKHFDPTQKKRKSQSTPEAVASYRAHLQIQKKSSIEVLNEQLREKIAAQSDALLVHKQQSRVAHLKALRIKEEAREHARRMKEVQREREIKAKREKKCGGADLFSQSKKKFEGIERRPLEDNGNIDGAAADDKDYNFMNFKPQIKAKVIISSDEEDEEATETESASSTDSDDSDADLLNLGNESECEQDCNEELPEMDEAMTALLSGKFESEPEPEETNNDNVATDSVSKGQKYRSEFIDDEASDEDEEMEGDDLADEEALELDMRKSKFIAESSDEEEDGDRYDTIQFINQDARRKDEEITNRLMAKYGKHMLAEEEELLDNLGKRYGVVGKDRKSEADFKGLSHVGNKMYGDDEDIQKLLDPIEQKKRKLAALGPWNILQRQRTLEAADDEFCFKDETAIKRPSHRDFERDDHESSDYYASETDGTDLETADDLENDDEKYYEAVESGLQSRVEEMLDAELLDREEVQVQASESLSAHLNAISVNADENAVPLVTVAFEGKVGRTAGVTVPHANAKLRSRLLALQQETDDSGEGNGSADRKGVFKGFTFK